MKRHTDKNKQYFGVGGLLVLAVVGAVGLYVNPTWALNKTSEATVNFAFNSTLTMQVSGGGKLDIGDMGAGTAKESQDIGITIDTNNAGGYYLSATAGNQTTSDFTSDTASGRITHLAEADAGKDKVDALSDNTWAVKVTGGDSGVSNGKYIGLPQDIGGSDKNAQAAGGKKLVDASGPSTAKKVDVKVGIKVGSTLPSGTYKTYLNFYAVTK